MTVQTSLCRTRLETQIVVFSCDGSYFNSDETLCLGMIGVFIVLKSNYFGNYSFKVIRRFYKGYAAESIRSEFFSKNVMG